MHVLLCIVTGRYSPRLYIAYAPLVCIFLIVTYKNIITSLSLFVSLKSLNVQVRVMHAIFYFPALDLAISYFKTVFIGAQQIKLINE